MPAAMPAAKPADGREARGDSREVRGVDGRDGSFNGDKWGSFKGDGSFKGESALDGLCNVLKPLDGYAPRPFDGREARGKETLQTLQTWGDAAFFERVSVGASLSHDSSCAAARCRPMTPDDAR